MNIGFSINLLFRILYVAESSVVNTIILLQKQGSWAVRNMVSRDKSLCNGFLELGAEDILRRALKHGNKVDFDVKAALRDLGCNID